MTLPASDQADWRRIHIPHRVRAAIACLPMEQSILRVNALVDPGPLTADQKIYWRCLTNSIWEGRLAATRWLVGFVGVSRNKKGKLSRPRKEPPADVQIDDFDLGSHNLFDLSTPDAHMLAEVWKGCSQASSHATHNSNHPPVTESALSKALDVIVRHLQETIYKNAGENIRDYVLEPVS